MSEDEEKILVISIVSLLLVAFIIISFTKDSRNDNNDFDWDTRYYPSYDSYEELTGDATEEILAVIEEPDWFSLDDHVVEVPHREGEKGSSDYGLDINNNSLYEFLILEVNLEAKVDGKYTIIGKLCLQNERNACKTSGFYFGLISKQTRDFTLTKGIHRIAFLFPGFKINHLENDGPYEAWVCIQRKGVYNPCVVGYDSSRTVFHITSDYSFEDFEKPRYNFQSFSILEDYGTDDDNNSYLDNLTIIIETDVLKSGKYQISSSLRNDCIGFPFYNSIHFNLIEGYNRIELNFSGEQIYMMELNGPYRTKISMYHTSGLFSNPTPFNYYSLSYDMGYVEIEYMTQSYSFDEFEHAQPPAYFTGIAEDNGIDTDGDGLFDYLSINFEVQVDNKDDYQITAHLYKMVLDGTCENKTTLGYEWDRFHLDVGTHNIQLNISPYNIRGKGIDGPYIVQVQILPISDLKDPILIFSTKNYSHKDFDK